MQVLITIPMDSASQETLRSLCPSARFHFAASSEVTRSLAQSARVILGNVSPDLIAGSPNLRFLQLNSAGTDGYLKEGVLAEDVFLSNATGAYGLAISEHMVGAALMLMKKLHLYHDNQKNALWKDEGPVVSIYGSTSLIIGAGDIGTEFARRVKALGSHTVGIRRTPSGPAPFFDEMYTSERLNTLLPKADIVALSLPNTPETVHIITRERLLAMKKTAVLLNVGRGTAVDTDALAEILASGHLLGAALDVTDPEPLPPSHPLWSVTNALITPHISGAYHLPETLARIIKIALKNFALYVNGQEPENLVDRKTGYRKKT